MRERMARRAAAEDFSPRPMSHNDLPAYLRRGFTDEQKELLVSDVLLAQQDHYAERGHAMSPSALNLALNEALFRAWLGASPADMMLGEIRGGPLRGAKIRKAEITLSARGMGTRIELAAGFDTKQGNAAGDQALVYGFADTNSFGGLTGIVKPPLMAQILVKKSRSPVFLSLCEQGIAPDFSFEQILQNTDIYDALFEGASLKTLKASMLPRKEGQTGQQVRQTWISTTHTVREYFWHTTLTLEVLRSRANGLLGLENQANVLLAGAPRAIGDYDIVQGLWNGMEYGTQRRYDATNGAWLTSAGPAAPWGSAAFITSNAKQHVAWWHLDTGTFYEPAADANYRKYLSSGLLEDGIFPANSNDFLNCLHLMRKLMRAKHKKLDAVYVHPDLLTKFALSEKAQNTLYGPDNPVLGGESGYKGTLRLPGSGDRVDLWEYDDGALPAFTTGDSPAIGVDYLMLGICYENRPMLYGPFIPPMLFTMPEQGVVAVDGANVTRPTLRDVISLLHGECVEPNDLTSCVMVKVLKGASKVHP